MAIVDCCGNEVCKSAPKVVDVTPVGSLILVEHLSAQEVLGTTLSVSDSVDAGSPQAYIVKIGFGVPKEVGLEVGQRVALQGKYLPVPSCGATCRERGLVEWTAIKAILTEA